MTDNSGAARSEGMGGRRLSTPSAAANNGNEETKTEGAGGRLTAENLAALGGSDQADAVDEMRRKYAI